MVETAGSQAGVVRSFLDDWLFGGCVHVYQMMAPTTALLPPPCATRLQHMSMCHAYVADDRLGTMISYPQIISKANCCSCSRQFFKAFTIHKPNFDPHYTAVMDHVALFKSRQHTTNKNKHINAKHFMGYLGSIPAVLFQR